MAPSPAAGTDGSNTWTPDQLFDSPENWQTVQSHLKANGFRSAIASAFELPPGDSFTYHATASVNLAQAEAAIQAGRTNGLHAWYVEADGEGQLQTAGYPPSTDIQAYISLFDPTKSSANSLKSLAANAKKDSLRATIAEHLLGKRHLDPSITVPKTKSHPNPALDFWTYSCMALEYAGPNTNTALVKMSHHVLPIYMHHFGCVVPSWESLQIISKLANGRSILDMGSGNGYWTLMLRRLGLNVVAVDSGQSRWRTTWIADTVVTDGVQYLRKRSGCSDMVLLLVYPIVGGDFTRTVLDSFTGNVICVAGTQNGNGYTGFKDMMIDEFMNKPGWEKIAQVPLPSFAGKDDALFAFRKTDNG